MNTKQEKMVLFTTSTGKKYPVNEADRVHWVRYPVQNEYGYWEPVLVKENGYDRIGPVIIPTNSEEECQKSCDIHNNYLGFTKEEVNEIVAWSMGLNN